MHIHHKLQGLLPTDLPEFHMLNATITLQDVSNGAQKLCPLSTVELSLCANFIYFMHHIEPFILNQLELYLMQVDLCLTIGL